MTQLSPKFPSLPRWKSQQMSRKAVFPPKIHQPFSCSSCSPVLHPLPRLPWGPGLNHPGVHLGSVCTQVPSRASPQDAPTSGRAEMGAGSVLPRASPQLWLLHPQPAQGWRSRGSQGDPPEPLREDAGVAARPAQPTLAGRRAPGGIWLCPDVLAGPRPTPSSWTPLASCVRQRNDAPSYCK